MNSGKNLLHRLGNANVSPFLSRVFLGIAVIFLLSIFTVKCFGHLHLEIDLPEPIWEKMEKEENQQAYERVWKDPDNASQDDKDKEAIHENDTRV